ncbi:hypothetical protein HYN49_10530 [Flavobacterium pallidum]|uniref:Uncharacterized protein n=2 Tax=Flavobacterium pallidum TaxID=2172098 RepID=A0A2S1SIR1_9FLAO|nr:hypothetical protein HYN49_10530 [Flavobacterium pallidum]
MVSSADSSLITTELGSLKKYNRTIDEIISADLKITEAKVPSKKTVAKKKSKRAQIKFKKQLTN